VDLPELPGGASMQFWWILLIIAVIVAGMLGLFRRARWL
jgi:Mg2+ and Co2+ transporter CorA